MRRRLSVLEGLEEEFGCPVEFEMTHGRQCDGDCGRDPHVETFSTYLVGHKISIFLADTTSVKDAVYSGYVGVSVRSLKRICRDHFEGETTNDPGDLPIREAARWALEKVQSLITTALPEKRQVGGSHPHEGDIPDFLAFTGLKGSGKTTAAEVVSEHLGHKVMSFADPVRAAAKAIYGVEEEWFHDRDLKEKEHPVWGVTPRKMMRDIGMMMRDRDPDHWIKNMASRLERTEGPVVIDDVRFMNEAEWVRSEGGTIVGLKRKGAENDDEHPSEKEMRDEWENIHDVEIQNDVHRPSHLYDLICDWMHEFERFGCTSSNS